MKIIITESQYKKIMEEEEQEVLHIPSLKYFNNDWNSLQEYLESEGNPPYSIGGNLNLVGLKVESLGNLVSVEHDLYAYDTPLKSLGSLTSVGGLMDLSNTQIESLGNLSFVGGSLVLKGTPLFPKDASPRSKQRMEDTIHQTVYVQGNILYYY
jgi:hypothetical protein